MVPSATAFGPATSLVVFQVRSESKRRVDQSEEGEAGEWESNGE